MAVAAAFVVFRHLDIGAWFDETFSYGMATQPLGTVFAHWVWGSESNMVLYYLALRAWLGLVSLAGGLPVEVVLRLPSALFAVAASVVVFLIGRSLFGRLAGLVAAGLYMTNFLQMILAQNARSYTLELFLTGLSWLFLFSAVKTGRRRAWLAYAIATPLSIYAALFAGLVIAAQVVAFGLLAVVPGPWRTATRKAAVPFAVALGASFLFVAPLVLDAVVHGGPTWIKPADVNDYRLFLHTLTGGSHLYAFIVSAGAAGALVLAAATHTRRWTRFTNAGAEQLGSAAAVAAWFVVPIGLSAALTEPVLNLHLFYSRYLVVAVPPMCLLVGLGVTALPSRALQALTTIVVLAVALPPLASYYQVAQVADYRTPVLWLQHRYEPQDGVVCDPTIQCAVPVEYYLAAYPGRAHLDADSPGVFDWATGESIGVTPAYLDTYATEHTRIFFIYAPSQRSAPNAAKALALQQELIADGYRVVDRTPATATSGGIEILLFVKQ